MDDEKLPEEVVAPTAESKPARTDEDRRKDRERKRKSRANQAAENSAWICGVVIEKRGIYFDGQFVRLDGSETILTLDGREKKVHTQGSP